MLMMRWALHCGGISLVGNCVCGAELLEQGLALEVSQGLGRGVPKGKPKGSPPGLCENQFLP